MEIINKIKYKFGYFRELMILALPVLVGELGHMLTGVTDVAVISRYSTDALGAVSIANSIIFTVFIFGLGIQNAISIMLSKKRGEKEDSKKYFSTVLLYSIILSLIFTLICLMPNLIIDKIGLDEKLVPYVKKYIFIVAFSMPGLFIFQGLKEFLQAFETVNVPNIILLSSVVLNLILNIVFIFGCGNIPSMGVEGAALATLLVRFVIAGAILIYALKLKLKPELKINIDFMKKLTILGLPMGAAWMFEFLAFNLVTVLVGRIDGTLSATHGILTNISCITFAFPVSVAIALCVKTAYHFGANEPEKVKEYYKTALITGVGFMAIISGILILFPKQIMHIYTTDTEVINYAMPVIIILAMYQVFDGFQTITGGILKGFKKTVTVSLSVIASYWLIGAPVAYVLTTKYNLCLKGYWMALAISLCVMGIVQGVYATKLLKIKDYSAMD